MLKNFAAITLAAASILTSKFSMRQTGAEIYALQSRLFNLGYYDKKVTGMYGTITEAAYKKFQQLNGFTENGIISDSELLQLYSMSVIPKLDSKRNILKVYGLSTESFKDIDAKVTQSFQIKFVTKNDKTATFKVKSSQGHLIGQLEGIKTDDLNMYLRYPIVATINGVSYPASLDYNSAGANLHFKDSWTYLNFPDSEHQSNINRLLGL